MVLRNTEIGLPAGETWLDGILAHHPQVPGLIVLLERSGSTLNTSRGAFVKAALNSADFATLQVALLSHEEERKNPEVWRRVSTLAPRIEAVLEWIDHQPALKKLPLGVLARDAATAAMIRVAARASSPPDALASRSGRPDLAGLEPLQALATPLLLVTGELDDEGPGPNQQAYEQLSCPRELAVIEGASHAFEELGTLEEASQRIVTWFQRWLCPRDGTAPTAVPS
ncbi:MAG: alpha/beta hydrolase [Gammaproteobacteria bacterium]|nr:alpha/beta hydrolase [Gammaproteobacteria bacterium]MBU1414362.1 alpha/beta hydrolase [Gammaproteobacteria bacterium]